MSFFITYWYGVPRDFISRERLLEAAQAGFDVIECRYDTATNLQVLDWCRQLGMRAFVWDDRMRLAIDEAPGWEQALDGMIADYGDHPALDRFFVRDEPYASHFPMLARIAHYLQARGQKFYVNLYPPHGLPEEDYNTHVSTFLDMTGADLLSYDHYCMRKRPVTDAQRAADPYFVEARVSDACRRRNHDEHTVFEEYNSAGYFRNLELIRRHALSRGLPWMIIILLSEHWDYRWLTEAELRWEVFTALAYGMNALSYFTYWTPGVAHKEPWTYHNAIINADGSRNENYWRVGRINAVLRDMVAVMDGARSLAVFHVEGDPDPETVPFTGYGAVRTIEGAPLVAGFFEGGLCVLANKDFHADRTVAVSCDKLLRQYNTDRHVWDTLPPDGDGRYIIRLRAGDGTLLRVEE